MANQKIVNAVKFFTANSQWFENDVPIVLVYDNGQYHSSPRCEKADKSERRRVSVNELSQKESCGDCGFMLTVHQNPSEVQFSSRVSPNEIPELHRRLADVLEEINILSKKPQTLEQLKAWEETRFDLEAYEINPHLATTGEDELFYSRLLDAKEKALEEAKAFFENLSSDESFLQDVERFCKQEILECFKPNKNSPQNVQRMFENLVEGLSEQFETDNHWTLFTLDEDQPGLEEDQDKVKELLTSIFLYDSKDFLLTPWIVFEYFRVALHFNIPNAALLDAMPDKQTLETISALFDPWSSGEYSSLEETFKAVKAL